jgi:hypothetical protein
MKKIQDLLAGRPLTRKLMTELGNDPRCDYNSPKFDRDFAEAVGDGRRKLEDWLDVSKIQLDMGNGVILTEYDIRQGMLDRRYCGSISERDEMHISQVESANRLLSRELEKRIIETEG